MTRARRWTALLAWALLGWGFVARGGFTFAFLFTTFSLLAMYSWLIRWVGLRGLRVQRVIRGNDGEAPRDGVFAVGEECVVEVTLRRTVPLPVPWMVVREVVGDAEHDLLHGPWLTRTTSYRYALPLPRRGVFAFEPTVLWTGDPFGIVPQRLRARGDVCEVAAAPEPRAFGPAAERMLAALGSGRRAPAHSADERTDVRSYRPGDPMTRILWKLAARTDEWVVRAAEDAWRSGGETAVVVDVSGEDEARTDACAAAAAGVIATLAARRRAFRLVAIDTYADRGSRPGAAGGFPGAAGRLPGAAGGFPGAAGGFPGAAGGFPGAAGQVSGGGWRRRLAALGHGETRSERAGYEGSRMHALSSAAGPIVGDRTYAVVVVCDGLRPETAASCRAWRSDGLDVLVVDVIEREAGGTDRDARAWLELAGIRWIEALPEGERTASEGGGGHAGERHSFSS